MGFHARVTSEDNEDFEQEMRQEVKEKKQRMDIIYNSTGLKANSVQNLLLAHGTDTGISDNTSQSQAKILPSAQPKDSIQLLDTKAELDIERMPPPLALGPQQSKQSSDNQISTLQTSNTTSISTASSLPNACLVEYNPKKTSQPNHKEKEVISFNTRFTYQHESRLVSLNNSNPSTTPSISNDLINYQSDTTTDLDASPNPISMEREAHAVKLNQERESYVTMTPLIVPGSGGVGGSSSSRDDGSPIVTWGEVATPIIARPDHDTLDIESINNGNDVPTFVLPQKDDREQTARFAESLVVQELRKVKGEKRQSHTTPSSSIGTCTPIHGIKHQKLKRKPSSVRSNSTLHDRTQSLTPAARSLMERKTKTQSSYLNNTPLFSSNISARSSSSLGSVLRSSYTPNHGTRQGTKVKQSSSRRNKFIDAPTPRSSINMKRGIKTTQNDIRINLDAEKTTDLTGGLLKQM